jgi:peptidoglycan-associated lipoprotein
LRTHAGVVALLLALLSLGGCQPKWQNGWCETSDDCRLQAGFGKVCVQGRCQECDRDADCKAGFGCRELKCVPAGRSGP